MLCLVCCVYEGTYIWSAPSLFAVLIMNTEINLMNSQELRNDTCWIVLLKTTMVTAQESLFSGERCFPSVLQH